MKALLKSLSIRNQPAIRLGDLLSNFQVLPYVGTKPLERNVNFLKFGYAQERPLSGVCRIFLGS